MQELDLQVTVDRTLDVQDMELDFLDLETKLEQLQERVGDVNVNTNGFSTDPNNQHDRIVQALNALRVTRPPSLEVSHDECSL